MAKLQQLYFNLNIKVHATVHIQQQYTLSQGKPIQAKTTRSYLKLWTMKVVVPFVLQKISFLGYPAYHNSIYNTQIWIRNIRVAIVYCIQIVSYNGWYYLIWPILQRVTIQKFMFMFYSTINTDQCFISKTRIFLFSKPMA